MPLSKPPTVSDTDAPLPIGKVVERIASLNEGIASFWSKSHGWAPVEAAGLLAKSRLDWQVSLSHSLRLWLRDPADSLTLGELILAWVNLGSLLEGTLKTFLSVWHTDYTATTAVHKSGGALSKKKWPKAPDVLRLEDLKGIFKKEELFGPEADKLIELIQERRNAVHAFKDRAIGDDAEFHDCVRRYLVLLTDVHQGLPYPDQPL